MRPSASQDEPEVPGYTDLELIDTGGFSRVFRAKQEGLDRPVVLKILDSGFETAPQQKAFERECRAMGRLSQHPNIVTVFSAAFSTAGRPCIVMEFYEEGSLADRVIAHGPLDPDQVIRTGLGVCQALNAAHSAGIVHRDIKPQNLFGSQYAGVVLGDFGISSFEDDRTLTQSGSGLTVNYAPPELLEGEAATAASDVYSLAATLYYLVTGEKPFPKAPGESLADVARRILIAPPPVFDRHGPNRQLGLVLSRAMAKKPADRPASARAFEAALSELNDRSEITLIPGTVLAPEVPDTVPEPAQEETESPEPVATEVVASAPATSRDEHTLAADDLLVEIDRIDDFAPQSADPFADPEPEPSGPRRGLVIPLLAVLAVGLVALFSLGGDESESTPISSPTSQDSFFGAPNAPDGLTISVDPDSAVVEWEPVEGADEYEVTRLDIKSVSVVATPRMELEIEPGERPCVKVRSVGSGGRLSLDSETICAAE